MTDTIGSLFTGAESQKRQEIVDLMRDWKEEIASRDRSDYFGEEDALSYFTADGFFPGYYHQKTKLLFIEREPRYMNDFVQDMIMYFENNNGHTAFTRHLLQIVQGVKGEGKINFENLKKAGDYAKEMARTNDYGFAYMNISKYSNWGDDGGKADFFSINKFLEHSNLEKRNFFREELEILEPDIIITGNLWDVGIEQKYLDLCFGKLEKIKDYIDGKVNIDCIIINGKNVKLINTYHLASRYSAQEYFYDPVMKILFGEK